jgi:type VII secretion protein EccB
LTTRAQVNGYRFLLRRLDHAMVRRDVRMLHDPMSSQLRSLIVGLVLAVLVTAGCAILAFLRPQGAVGDAHILVGKDSGGMYAVVGGTVHPVLNLASARLIVGGPESPASVKDDRLAGMPRGPLLGIPGAPQALPGPHAGEASTWTLCQTGAEVDVPPATTAIVGPLAEGRDTATALRPTDALLARSDDKTYLLYDGKRAEIDPSDDAVARAIGLRGQRPRPVAPTVLAAAVAVPPVAAPRIPDSGRPAGLPHADLRVGAVVKVVGVNSTDFYVVLRGAVQHVSPLAAEIIRDADSQGMSEIATVPPDALDAVPVVDTLPVDAFPAQRPTVVAAEDAPVACVSWSRGDGDTRATLRLLAGQRLPLRAGQVPVTMAGAGGTDHVDAAYLPPSTGVFVQATGIEPGSVRRDSLFFVGDTGVRYGVADRATAAMLGLGDPSAAPWQILGTLVPGPTLTRSAALVAHDSLPADSPVR